MAWMPVPRESFVSGNQTSQEENLETKSTGQKVSDFIHQEHVPKKTTWKEFLILTLIVLGICWGTALLWHLF
ncbi:hypothetical protein [Methanorbis rubei]